uniref:NADH dehydrogenase subunit 6 n=1 Tax=Prosadenoporus spectaculum TaxID=1332185 RepID=X2C8U9_9BILA|nr:NADH dehydrogenase subunit 6 [Prosadenoporus spectaculum]AGL46775.1 NADH dehydrogenase subunit 6 [Prosadenoporus spectaculum]
MMLIFVEVMLFLVLSLVLVAQQPLSMGFFLLVYCFFSSVMVFSFFSSWFSLSLFLIYIGGMLVLFGYVLVLIPNFVFSVKLYPFFFFFLFFFFYLRMEKFLFQFVVFLFLSLGMSIWLFIFLCLWFFLLVWLVLLSFVFSKLGLCVLFF